VPLHRGRQYAGLAALVALGAATRVHAETSPYSLGASVSVVHDSNVFRTTDQPVSDTTRSAGLVASLDQPIGRQRLLANATVSTNRHVRLGQLDNTSYAVTGGLDWASVQQLSGQFRYATSSGLADYGLVSAPRSEERNLQHAQQWTATAHWALHSHLALESSLEHRSLDYSSQAFAPLDYRQNVAGLDLQLGAAGRAVFSIGGRLTRGVTPNFRTAEGGFDADRLRRRDIDFAATYRTLKTAATMRISLSHESHSQESYPGFSGVTGSLEAEFTPTPKLRLSAGTSRDTGSATTFYRFAPNASAVQVDTSRLTTIMRLAASFAITPKVTLGANARASRDDQSSVFGSTASRTTSFDLSAEFQILRFLKLACDAAREVRSVADGAIGTPSQATVVGCSATTSMR
jgi:hypothetical protein